QQETSSQIMGLIDASGKWHQFLVAGSPKQTFGFRGDPQNSIRIIEWSRMQPSQPWLTNTESAHCCVSFETSLRGGAGEAEISLNPRHSPFSQVSLHSGLQAPAIGESA